MQSSFCFPLMITVCLYARYLRSRAHSALRQSPGQVRATIRYLVFKLFELINNFEILLHNMLQLLDSEEETIVASICFLVILFWIRHVIHDVSAYQPINFVYPSSSVHILCFNF